MVHPLPVVHVLGPVIAMFGAAMLLPLVVAHTGHDAAQSAYDLAALVLAFVVVYVNRLAYRRLKELEDA